MRAGREEQDGRAQGQRELELTDTVRHGPAEVPGHFGKLSRRTGARLHGGRIGRVGHFLASEPNQEASCGR